MHEILPGRLWIGNAGDMADMPTVMETGVSAIVDLATELSAPHMPRSMIHLRFPILDGDENPPEVLQMVVQTIASLMQRRVPTLIFCSAGMSRSPAVMAHAMALAEGRDPKDCLRQIVAGRPHDVSPALWRTLGQALEAIRSGAQ